MRAFEKQICIAYPDNADGEGNFTYQGLSSIAASDGAGLTGRGRWRQAKAAMPDPC